MPNLAPSVQPGRNPPRPLADGVTRIALDENELAARWGPSVKTLRRWRWTRSCCSTRQCSKIGSVQRGCQGRSQPIHDGRHGVSQCHAEPLVDHAVYNGMDGGFQDVGARRAIEGQTNASAIEYHR